MNTRILLCLTLLLLSCHQQEDSCICLYPEDNILPIEDLATFNAMDSGIECATRCKKPIFLFFNNWTVSTRKMEKEILVEKSIQKRLKNEFVLVALFVDDKEKLPPEEIGIWNFNGKERIIRNYGNRNTKYQIEKFNMASQPFFAVLDHQGEQIFDTFGYLPDAQKVDSILNKAIKKYSIISTKAD